MLETSVSQPVDRGPLVSLGPLCGSDKFFMKCKTEKKFDFYITNVTLINYEYNLSGQRHDNVMFKTTVTDTLVSKPYLQPKFIYENKKS